MSKQINIENYEEWFIGYLEGTLSEADLKQLEGFLAVHPELKEELDLISLEPVMAEEQEMQEDFSFLLKPEKLSITPMVENSLVALMEGDLNAQEAAMVKSQIAAYPEMAKEWELTLKTKLSADELVMPGKDALLRKEQGVILPLWIKRLSVAAALLVIGTIGWQISRYATVGETAMEAGRGIERERVRERGIEGEREGEREGGIERETGRERERVAERETETERVGGMGTEAKVLERRSLGQLEINNTLPVLAKIEPAYVPMGNKPKIEESKFLKPHEWLLSKAEKAIPQNPLTKIDSAYGSGPVAIAGTLLNKTTGISIQDNRDPESNAHKFAIVSKYFSIERVTYAKN